MNFSWWRGMAASGGLCLLLAGCGGGSSGDTPQPPASLTLSDDVATVAWNKAATVDVVANDRVSAGAMSVTAVTAPAHGTATIEGGRIVYTPSPGYFGSDVLTYSVRAEQGGTTATARLSLTIQAQIRLSGTVTDAPVPNARLTLEVGGRQVQATADAGGAYSALLSSSDGQEMVRIEAAGSAPGSPIRLVSLVGPFSALAAAADAQSNLPASVQPRLNITHHTTAAAALAITGNGGTAPATGTALDAALAAVSPDEMVRMAALIQGVVDGGVALPPGKADVWALVNDTSGFLAFTRSVLQADSGAFGRAMVAAQQSRPIGKAPTAEDLVGKELVFYGDGNSVDRAFLLRFSADGQVVVRHDQGHQSGRWVREAQRIVITYDKPWSIDSFSSDLDPITQDQNQTRIDRSRLILRQHALVPGHYSVTEVQTETYLDGSRAGRTVSLVAEDDAGWSMQAMDLARRLPVDAAEFGTGKKWGGLPNDLGASPGNLAQDAIVVGAGGAANSLLDASRTYRVSVADALVSVSSVLSGQAQAPMHYARLKVGADGAERWLQLAPLGATALTGAVASLPVVPIGDVTLDPAGAARLWLTQLGPSGSSEFSLYADFTGRYRSDLYDGSASDIATRWQLVPAGLEVTYGASLSSVRTWQPLKRQGSSLWVLETRTIRRNGSETFLYSRVYRLIDLGPALPG